MRNINLLYHPELIQQQQSRKMILCLVLACVVPFAIIKTAASFLNAEILESLLHTTRLEKEQQPLAVDKLDFKKIIQATVYNLNIIASTIPEEMFLLSLQNDDNFLLIQGRALDASAIMMWAETLKEKMPSYELQINSINKVTSKEDLLVFELQLDKK